MEEGARDKLGKTLAELVQVAAIAIGKHLAEAITQSIQEAKEVQKEKLEELEEVQKEGEKTV